MTFVPLAERLRPKRLAVVTGSERTLAGLVATAGRSGWRASGASTETTDPLAMTRLLLDRTVEGIVVGAGDPPRADERGAIRELAALVSAVATRRPSGDSFTPMNGRGVNGRGVSVPRASIQDSLLGGTYRPGR